MKKSESAAMKVNNTNFHEVDLEEKVCITLDCLRELREFNSQNSALAGAVVDSLDGIEGADVGHHLSAILEHRVSNTFC